MKFISLKITNIASIEYAELHFDHGPLADEPLFLISGPTGAGKTTILNAICLALYNKVPSLLSSGSTDNDREGVANNNPAQLLRRGTGRGEVELVFEGNNCCRYCAVWEARRSRNRASGTMRPVSRRLDNLSNGSALTRVRDIEDEIRRVIGLSFDQFTRTTLLAQGQFAAFIKAKESDKAEILEKLTGTELYTRIGCNVYQLAREADSAVETMKAQIAATSILSDEERMALVERIAVLTDSITEKAGKANALDCQIRWLQRQEALVASLASNRLALEKAVAETSSPEAVNASATIELWDATVEIRRLLSEKKQSKKAVEDIARQIQSLGNREQLAAAEQEAAKAVELQMEKVEAAEAEAKKCDMNSLTKEFRAATEEQARLARAEVAVINLDKASADLAHTQESFADISRQLSSAESDLSAKRAMRPELEKRVGEWGAIRQARLDLKSHITQLRVRFADTHQCPLCGTKGVALHDDETLDEAFESVEATYETLRKELAGLDGEISALTTKVKVLRRTSADLQLESARRNVALQKAALEVAAYGIDPTEDGLLDRIGKEKIIAACKSKVMEEALAKAKRFMDAVTDAQKVLARLQGEKEKAMLANRKLEMLSGKHENAESILSAKDADISRWYDTNGVEQEQVESVAKFSSEDIEALRQRRLALVDRMRQAEGAVNAMQRELDEHSGSRPQIGENVTAEILLAEKKAIEETKDAEMVEKAAAETRIVEDRRNASLIADRRQKLSELVRIRDNWNLLDRCFGGADGKRFRNLAQSYVLRVLLHKSNHYMAHLLPRYRLDCDDASLTINVVDSFRNDSVRSIGLLSGGESFIVSLALALGLSSIAKDKINVDILFIDEGFGSLDRDTLDVVLDTLDNLYRIGGRRIGLISHVESMIERIPARIVVNPTSPSASSVEVVCK